ncbi:MAG: glucans biosynthesis glucosyltransferase MdoH, partial [Pseudomonadota bacterium]
MTDSTSSSSGRLALSDLFGAKPSHTPAGLQPFSSLVTRRFIVLGLNLALLAVLTAGIVAVFGAGGWTAAEYVILACFLLGAPWSVMGVVNALLGLWLLHGARDGVMAAAPHLSAADEETPVSTRTAVAMTVRNEPPEAAFLKLAEVRRSLDATGQGALFDFFILS